MSTLEGVAMNEEWILGLDPIPDIRDWSAGQRLESRQDFQRKWGLVTLSNFSSSSIGETFTSE